jgi:hypothetical protein
VQVAEEPAQHRHPKRQPTAPARWQTHPGHHVIDGDRVRTLIVEVADELGQELGMAFEREPEAAADPQVLLELAAEIDRGKTGHDTPPGQGRASARKPSRSILA